MCLVAQIRCYNYRRAEKEGSGTDTVRVHDPIPSTSGISDKGQISKPASDETKFSGSLKTHFNNILSTKGRLTTEHFGQDYTLIIVYIIIFSEGGQKHHDVTMKILFFICKDMRPFNIVEGEGFLQLMKELAPTYKVPSSKYFKQKLVEKCDVVIESCKTRICAVSYMSLTLDIWTETMSERSFLGVTVHFLEGVNMTNFIVGTRELNERHTGKYIAENLSKLLEFWSIPINKIRCIISDNGANVVSAIKSLVGDKCHFPCFAHTVNLIVEVGLKCQSVKPIISKVRTVVKWIKNSVINSDKLRKIQLGKGIPEGSLKKMILDVCTRWNSVFYMLERFIEMVKICSDLILDDHKSPEMPSSQEIEILKQLVDLLKPFEFITREASAENYVTISKIIPMISCLRTKMQNFTSTFSVVKDLQSALKVEIEKRFGNIESNSMVAIATILDPRFKNLHFQDLQACNRAVQNLRDQYKREMLNSSDSDADEGVIGTENPHFDFWQHHNELLQDRQRSKSASFKTDEISLYLAMPLSPLKNNPLEDWEQMKPTYPFLYKEARKYLMIVGSSVPCERLFSKAGATVTQTRNRLSGKHLEKLLFLGNVPKEVFFDK